MQACHDRQAVLLWPGLLSDSEWSRSRSGMALSHLAKKESPGLFIHGPSEHGRVSNWRWAFGVGSKASQDSVHCHNCVSLTARSRYGEGTQVRTGDLVLVMLFTAQHKQLL